MQQQTITLSCLFDFEIMQKFEYKFFSVLNLNEYPDSYKENTNKEKLILAYTENYRRQYVHLFRDRKPLFLNPLNECNIEVMISWLV